MEKFNNAKLLSILVMIFILVGFMPTICKAEEKAEENNSITMNVSYGIDGKFKGSMAIPVNVEVENKGEDIEGQVEVRVPTNSYNTYDAFVSEVKLASKEKRTVTIPINLPEDCSKMSVVFTKGKNILKENKITVSSGRVNENDLFMAILTDDFNGINIKDLNFADLNNKNRKGEINKTVNVPLNLDSLSKGSKNISQLDVIVINNYNISNLQKEQYENLSTWINNGGTLIIGSGENASKTIGSIDKEFLDVNYKGTKDVNGYTLANLSLKDSSIKLQQGENPLIYLLNKGKGKVYIGAFDLGNKNIASKDNVMNTWKESLGNDFINKNNIRNRYGNGNNVPHQMDQLSNDVPVKEDFKMGVLISIFICYALIAGIIVYLIMKKLNKREWLWGVVPAIAIGFSLVLYLLGGSTRIQDLVLNQVNIIITDESGTSTTSGYVGIGSKYKDDLIVKEPNGASIQAYYSNNDNYNGRNKDANALTKLGTKTVYRENNSYYEFKGLSALQMKKFEISGHKEIVPKIEANLNYNSQKLVGKVKNTFGYDIKNLLVVSSNSVWDLGEIKSGEEKQTEVDTCASSGLNQYASNISKNYRDYKNSNDKKQNKEEFKDVLRMSSLLRGIEQSQLSKKSTYLVAITNIPVDYGFDFGEKSISKYDTTAIIQEINIDFTDTEGNLSYPLGYFKGEVAQADQNMDIDTQNNVVHGSGDMVLDYLVGNEINLLDLKVGYTENQNQKKSGLKGTVYIFNYEKNDYEAINYIVNGESLKNPNQYIKDGKVTVKLQGNDEEGIGSPQITVKGRAK
ncbi:hypothetical protein psyc5s11_45700 [Clostridium gelidum]|uniref:Membrane-associated protein n=1 Tax=Clostridium gelidum TaxID=704125 RepID=A0ABM7T9U3_9CLOT|nr:hypothetical protein [Clostridium gelidum]BCZ48503.1 hypothetical protein psyc5s11_45700 [Clostridium gelidum]